jgi:hypothetical protein
MPLKTYSGGCHCGAVRFEADLDLAAGSNRCNCSFCFKARAWFAFAKGAEHFRLLEGQDALSEYRWKPPARTEPFLEYAFCSHCGIRIFARAELPQLGGLFHAVQLSTLDTTLDDATADELAASPLSYADGRHDQFNGPPADVRLL